MDYGLQWTIDQSGLQCVVDFGVEHVWSRLACRSPEKPFKIVPEAVYMSSFSIFLPKNVSEIHQNFMKHLKFDLKNRAVSILLL